MAPRLSTRRKCAVNDCRNIVGSHGGYDYCSTHYHRFVKYGDPLVRYRIANGEAMKFIFDVALKHKSNTCLLWPFSKSSGGYGNVHSRGTMRTASSIVCEAVHGPPPSPGHVAAHTCDNRPCIAPRHLKWITQQRNLIDAVKRNRTSTKLTSAIIRKMRKLDGIIPRRQIAFRFGVGVTQTHRILNRESWAWLL
jgi:hypothetical protein